MKIAQIAPIWLRIPPKGSGGAELIISLLTEGLVDRGHNVTLFASGDSETKANLISVKEAELTMSRKSLLTESNRIYDLFNLFYAANMAEQFDLIHWHVSASIVPLMTADFVKNIPSVITYHNHFGDRTNFQDIYEYYKKRKSAYMISISNAHRKEISLDFYQTVYNGIDLKQFEYVKNNISEKKYLVWIGRFTPEKGADKAIEIAKKAGLPLKLAAKQPDPDSLFFKEKIEPYLDKDGIEYVGEVDSESRNALLQEALAFVFPLSWNEPFGLIVVESMAVGVPVVAYNLGAMSEIIEDGVNGYIVNAGDVEGMINKIKEIRNMTADKYQMMRYTCRKTVEEKFSSKIMVENYEKVYEKILLDKKN